MKIGRRNNSNKQQPSGASLSMASPSPQGIAMAPPVQNPAPAQQNNQYPPNPAAPPAQQQPTSQQQVQRSNVFSHSGFQCIRSEKCSNLGQYGLHKMLILTVLFCLHVLDSHHKEDGPMVCIKHNEFA